VFEPLPIHVLREAEGRGTRAAPGLGVEVGEIENLAARTRRDSCGRWRLVGRIALQSVTRCGCIIPAIDARVGTPLSALPSPLQNTHRDRIREPDRQIR